MSPTTEPDEDLVDAGDVEPDVEPVVESQAPPEEAASPMVALRNRLNQISEARDASDGMAEAALPDKIDLVATFRPAILAIRWGTTAVCLALAAEEIRTGSVAVAAWGAVVLAYTILRTIRPIRYTGDIRSMVTVLAEVALLLVVVSLTGSWESPYVFSLLSAIIVAGFARGFGFGIRIGISSSLAISILFLGEPGSTEAEFRLAAQWSASLILVGLVAGYARRISGEADRQHTLALDRLGRLADANALLFSLHRVTQTLPASLEMGDVLDNTVNRLKGLFDFDTVAVFLLDDTDTSWELLRKEGVRIPSRFDHSALPPALAAAQDSQGCLVVDNLQSELGPGLSGRAGSGMYAVLVARGSTIGLLAVENRSEKAYSSRDLELFRGFVEPVALAIDNARWFSRLRTVGADEERTRIARDLHDRIGQSLAYLGFELDRIVTKNGREESIDDDLHQLRSDIRGVVGEVRDTLYDLRTDVSEQESIVDVLESFASRVRERTDLEIRIVAEESRERLPLLQEREMWRVAQEAVVNAERHAKATVVTITWRCHPEGVLLEITDNGRGFPIGRAGRLDSYGIIGMRERASSIGATLDIISAEGQGTTVRCQLNEV